MWKDALVKLKSQLNVLSKVSGGGKKLEFYDRPSVTENWHFVNG
jgi:hypothetical protein